jgi:hypothetical protein
LGESDSAQRVHGLLGTARGPGWEKNYESRD